MQLYSYLYILATIPAELIAKIKQCNHRLWVLLSFEQLLKKTIFKNYHYSNLYFRKFSRRGNSKLPLLSSLLRHKLRPGARLGREELLFLCSETGSSETEVRGKYKTFLASHPSGQISHEAFDELLAECFPAVDLANIRSGQCCADD